MYSIFAIAVFLLFAGDFSESDAVLAIKGYFSFRAAQNVHTEKNVWHGKGLRFFFGKISNDKTNLYQVNLYCK